MIGVYIQSKSNKKNQHPVYFRIRTPEGSYTLSTGIRESNSLSQPLNSVLNSTAK